MAIAAVPQMTIDVPPVTNMAPFKPSYASAVASAYGWQLAFAPAIPKGCCSMPPMNDHWVVSFINSIEQHPVR